MSYERGKDKDLDVAVDRLRKLLPGFYPGCTIEILPTLVSRPAHIGKRFTACKEVRDIKGVADQFERGNVCWYIDRTNQYTTNYELKHLKVVEGIDSFADPDPFSDGYRMKTVDEIISEYGSKEKVACCWSSGMDPLSGLLVTNEFAKSVIRGNTAVCTKDHFKNPKTESFNWAISDQMITNKPLPAPKTEEPKELLVFDKFKIGQVVVSLKHNMGCREVNDLYEVSSDSDRNHLNYKRGTVSSSPDEWRAATEEETAYYKSGGKNIKDIKPLVFGTYNIGQVVVSLVDAKPFRYDGQLLQVLTKSREGALYYDPILCSTSPSEWRAATNAETAFYWENKHRGDVNINMMNALNASNYVDPVNSIGADQTPVPTKKREGPLLISDFTTAQLKPKNKRSKLSIN